jgi:hypothetical protein
MSNLSAEPVVDRDRAVRWAELATNSAGHAWYRMVLGEALFRAGRNGEAIRVLEQVASSNFDDRVEWMLALALAYLSEGEAAKARAWLDKGRAWIVAYQKVRRDDLDAVLPTDWGPAHVYLREAEARILYDPLFPADPFAR